MSDWDPASFDPGSHQRVRKVAEVVARMILDDAERLGLEPGDPLMPETKMMEVYSVGRASVREALRILEVQGLVSIRTGRRGGPVLERLKIRSVGGSLKLYLQQRHATYGDVLDAREALEPQLARRAARMATPAHQARIRHLSRQIDEVDPGDHAQLGVGAHRLSAAVGTASENPALSVLTQALRDIYSWRVHDWFTDRTLWEGLLGQFRHLALAIDCRDEEAAEEAMRRAIDQEAAYAHRRFPEVLAERVRWD